MTMKFEAYELAKQSLFTAGNAIAPDCEIKTRLIKIVTDMEDEGTWQWAEIIYALVKEIEFWSRYQAFGGPRLVRDSEAA